MVKVNRGTKKYEQLLWTWNNCDRGSTLHEAYKTKVSAEKYDSFHKIWVNAHTTEGYNYDLKVVAASSWFYSTMYSFTIDNQTFVVYDTHANTYIFEI